MKGTNKYGKIGRKGVVVPDAFFKVVMVPEGKSYKTIAFIPMNESEHHTLKEYAFEC